jgi:hypothetical protein
MVLDYTLRCITTLKMAEGLFWKFDFIWRYSTDVSARSVYAVSREMLLSKKAREIAQATTVITTHALHHGKRAISNSVRYLQ